MIRALAALVVVALSASGVARPFQGRDRGAACPELCRGESPALHQVTAPQRTAILDNATTTVTRLRFGPGAREAVQTHASPLVIVQLTPGDIVDLTVSDTRGRGPRDAGLVTFVPADVPYAIVNAGAASFDVIAIALGPTRAAAPSAPPTEAPPGITRTTLVDNNHVRIVRVRFAPGSREPVHTHPNDLLTVQLTPGTFDILLGATWAGGRRDAGFTQFLPRDISHAYVSTDSEAFDLLSISVK